MAVFVLKYTSYQGNDYYMRLARIVDRAWGWKWQQINFKDIPLLYPLTTRIYSKKHHAFKAGKDKERKMSTEIKIIMMNKEDVEHMVFIQELTGD